MIPQILLYLLVAIYFASLWKIFEKAGEEKWKGFVPVVNAITWLKIMKKPWWWVILLLIPGVNFLMLMVMNVELNKCFGHRKSKDLWTAIFLPWILIPQLAFKEEEKFVGPVDWSKEKKSRSQEWADAIIFAIVAASIIRTFFLEAFTIPTPSMEKDLLIGDYLFVSKMSYGPKVPNTPLSFPFAHHTLPLVNTKSYVEWFKLPYYRLPGFGEVERNDVVVFNFPAGDTIIDEPYLQGHTYYQILRDEAFYMARGDVREYQNRFDHYINKARKSILKKGRIYSYWGKDEFGRARKIKGIKSRPVDKRENYIKRCVAIPGDTLKIIDRQLYVNGMENNAGTEIQFNYYVDFNRPLQDQNLALVPEKMVDSEGRDDYDRLKSFYNISKSDINGGPTKGGARYMMPMTDEALSRFKEEMKKGNPSGLYYTNLQVKLNKKQRNHLESDATLKIYPNNKNFNWTEDNFGPLIVPKKGWTIKLSPDNFIRYRRPIEVYENNKVQIKKGEIFINGEKSTEYTFKMDYYWLMGDNRHKSADSRFWGFVPEDHVVGKAIFVWFSTDPETGIRWRRIFSLID